jgi:hypothetical protein
LFSGASDEYSVTYATVRIITGNLIPVRQTKIVTIRAAAVVELITVVSGDQFDDEHDCHKQSNATRICAQHSSGMKDVLGSLKV